MSKATYQMRCRSGDYISRDHDLVICAHGLRHFYKVRGTGKIWFTLSDEPIRGGTPWRREGNIIIRPQGKGNRLGEATTIYSSFSDALDKLNIRHEQTFYIKVQYEEKEWVD